MFTEWLFTDIRYKDVIFAYSARFGVHYVDFDNDNRTRTPKESAIQLTKIFADNGFPAPSSGIITVIPNQIVLMFYFVLFLLLIA